MSSPGFSISKRLDELWEIKDALAKEVEHLPTGEALRVLMEKANEAAAGSSLPRRSPARRHRRRPK